MDDEEAFLYGDVETETSTPQPQFRPALQDPAPASVKAVVDADATLATTNGSGQVVTNEAAIQGVGTADGEKEEEEEEEEDEEGEEGEDSDDSDKFEIIINKPAGATADQSRRGPYGRIQPPRTASGSIPPAQPSLSVTDYTPRDRGTPTPGLPTIPRTSSQAKLETPPSAPTLPLTPTPDVGEPVKQEEYTNLLELDIESLEEKPWRKPGALLSDYFNYGFDEATWKFYVQKQHDMRGEIKRDQENPFSAFATRPLEEAWQQLPPNLKGLMMSVITGMAPGSLPHPGMLPPGMMPPNMGGAMGQMMMGGMGGPGADMMMNMMGRGGGPGGMMGNMNGNSVMDGFSNGMGEMMMGGPGPRGIKRGRDSEGPGEDSGSTPDVDSYGGFGDYGGDNSFQSDGGGGDFTPNRAARGGRGGQPSRGFGLGRGGPPVPSGPGGRLRGKVGALAAPDATRPASPLPPNVPTGPRNPAPTAPRGPRGGAYQDKDKAAGSADQGLDYGGGPGNEKPESPVRTKKQEDDDGSSSKKESVDRSSLSRKKRKG